jgi:hypothetical protein
MVVFVYLKWMLSHLFVWAVMMLAAGCLGAAALRRHRFHSRVEHVVFALTLGLGLWSTIIFCLGLAGLIYWQVIWSITLIAALGTLIALVRRWRAIRAPLNLPSHKLDLRLNALWALALITLGYVFFLGARTLYPPRQWDAISNHLVMARQYLLDHQLLIVRGTPNQIIHSLNHLLFTWALAMKDDLMAQMIEFTLLILCGAGLLTYFLRRDLSFFGLAAFFFWIIHPLVSWVGTAAYVDAGLACYVFLGLYALLLFKEEQDAKWLYLAMALLAMAAGVKLPGIFFFSLAAGYALWRLIRGRLGLKQAMAGWSIGLLAILPWYGYLIYHTGNPLFPMFPQLNRGEWATPVAEAADSQNAFFSAFGLPKTVTGFLQLPYYLTFKQSAFFMDNYLGYLPVVGLWPLVFIFALWRRSLRWWSFWILAYTIFWFSSAAYLRYWMPVIPLLSLAFCEIAALIAERKLIPKIVLIIAGVSMSLGAVYVVASRGARAIKGRAIELPPVSESERQDFLARTGFMGYQGVLYINRSAAPGDTVFIVYGNYLNYYFTPKVIGFGKWLDFVGDTRTIEWIVSPGNQEAIKSKRPTWIYTLHYGNGPPTKQPFADHAGPQYELVYADADGYVFRLRL